MTVPHWQDDAPIADAGTWLLEASAGTGKTFQLANLVARLVVEKGVEVDRILVITFTRAATGELRGRIRDRLVQVRDGLRARLDSGAHMSRLDEDGEPIDRVLDLLCGVDDGDVAAARLKSCEVALSCFDLAPISTIHGFSQRMLDVLAFESQQDPNLTLLEDLGAIREQLVADEMATMQARVTADEFAAWKAAGWTPENLNEVVKKATSVVGRNIDPKTEGEAAAVTPAIGAALARFSTWWQTDGLAACGALKAAMLAPANKGRFYGRMWTPALVDKYAQEVGDAADGSDIGRLIAVLAKRFSPSMFAAVNKNKPPYHDARIDQVPGWLGALEEARDSVTPLAAFARRAADEVKKTLKDKRLLTFDAILTRLADVVVEEAKAGPTPLADAIAGRFDAVLVDEFQDTDSAQWQVLSHVFHGRPGKRLFLVGDPKQAIYAFRGADVFVYLAAKKAVSAGAGGGLFTMNTNWRSDEQLVAALERFWQPGSKAFGDLDMDFVEVAAAAKNRGWNLDRKGGALDRKPLEIRWMQGDPDDDGQPTGLSAPDALYGAARSCAKEIVELLQGGWTLPGNADAGEPDRRPVRPGDFAVIVLKHKEAAAVKSALARHGIMAVRAGYGTIFESPVTEWLLLWLDAVASPGYDAAARSLAVCPLFGRTLEELSTAIEQADQATVVSERDAGDDDAIDGPGTEPSAKRLREQPLVWASWVGAISKWANGWQKQRFMGVFGKAMLQYDMLEALLGCQEGERYATDLRHLAELCHIAERKHHFTPAGLAEWLRTQRTREEFDAEAPRLESDANAVQIVTVYRAKGLQYPIAMLPYCWGVNMGPRDNGPLVAHDEEDGAIGEAVLDLNHKDSALRSRRKARNALERRQERLRKLYVAMTRAKHHCVLWGALLSAKKMGEATANAMILRPDESGRRDDGDTDCYAAYERRFGSIWASKPRSKAKAVLNDYNQGVAAARALLPHALAELPARSAGTVGLRIIRPPTGRADRVSLDATSDATTGLHAAVFDGRDSVDSAWQRASYSSMPRGRDFDDPDLQRQLIKAIDDEAKAAASKADPHLLTDGDQQAVDRDESNDETDRAKLLLPLGRMWGGTTVGTWTHAVFEHLDFRAWDGETTVDTPPPSAFAAWRRLDDDARETAATASPYRGRADARIDARSAVELARQLGDQHGHRRRPDHLDLVLSLPHILHTPLADPRMGDWALPHGYCLARLAERDRVDEMAFDLSLAGGERWGRDGHQRTYIDPDAVTAALALRIDLDEARGFTWDGRKWLLNLLQKVAQSRAQIAKWDRQPVAERAAKRPKLFSIIPRIAGMLTGLIDLTFRVPGGGREIPGKGRADAYYVADYKTNKITAKGDRVVRPGSYRRAGLAFNMGHANYHLQGLIYCLALHRFLRDRLPDYDYDTHVGGHLYLYLRGMRVADDGSFKRMSPEDVRGVYADRWPKACIEALDVALDPDFASRHGGAA